MRNAGSRNARELEFVGGEKSEVIIAAQWDESYDRQYKALGVT